MSRTVFIGSVISSKIALETLIETGVKINLVCALDEGAAKNVSDYFPIHKIALANNIPFLTFTKINHQDVLNQIKKVAPDFIYVMGLSQILSENLLGMARKYSIGFHPTPLPKHRGRAAIPWQIILGETESKVSLFRLDQGLDSGDIIKQSSYTIEETDYAMDVYHKVCGAMKEALNQCIYDIYNDSVDFRKQDHEKATFLLVRRPEDGKIDWEQSGKEIQTLIRATSKPYPGAFSYYKGNKVIIWKAHIETNQKIIGQPGQIAWISQSGEIGVLTKDSILVITHYEVLSDENLFIEGHKFGSQGGNR
ncbi:methionyl-tRNA formyltransferase [Jeotgalibacillus campisalis]|uniref:Putative polymyxin resistance protein ArnA n=1 Tax=Jeotgalibacillus campisalis TaxID=220754 RepID=A0A0C2VGW5_9BACL|nr:formyltransferase family protein [Jeotgalibacillus campisalis]KIL43761.1 putative polymyxin resistance protein ArnA [Jeotgalibacillus campisalis]